MDVQIPVSDLRVSVYRMPTDGVEADGTYTWSVTTLALVEVTAGDRTGLGWTYAPEAAAALINDHLRDLLLGGCALDIPGLNATMAASVRNAGRPGVAACGISAVDIALWDLKARLLDLPLVRLLGRVHETVPVYGSGGFTSYDDQRLRQQVAGWVHGQGIRRVKIKIGEAWGRREDRDLSRIAIARDAIGDDAELYVDANGAYGRKQAIRVADRARDAAVTWFEEPVSSDDLTGLREVRDAVLPDVAAGEYGYDLAYFERMCSAGAVDCLQADVTRCGGITEWLRAAAVAAAHGLRVSGHTAPNLHAHVAAAVPHLRHLEWFHDHVRMESALFEGTLDPDGGVLRPGASGAPGLGMELRRPAAQQFRVG